MPRPFAPQRSHTARSAQRKGGGGVRTDAASRCRGRFDRRGLRKETSFSFRRGNLLENRTRHPSLLLDRSRCFAESPLASCRAPLSLAATGSATRTPSPSSTPSSTTSTSAIPPRARSTSALLRCTSTVRRAFWHPDHSPPASLAGPHTAAKARVAPALLPAWPESRLGASALRASMPESVRDVEKPLCAADLACLPRRRLLGQVHKRRARHPPELQLHGLRRLHRRDVRRADEGFGHQAGAVAKPRDSLPPAAQPMPAASEGSARGARPSGLPLFHATGAVKPAVPALLPCPYPRGCWCLSEGEFRRRALVLFSFHHPFASTPTDGKGPSALLPLGHKPACVGAVRGVSSFPPCATGYRQLHAHFLPRLPGPPAHRSIPRRAPPRSPSPPPANCPPRDPSSAPRPSP